MKRMLRLACVLSLGGTIAACGVAPLREVKVPVPVECRVSVPARPVMPTEALAAGVDIDRFAAAAMAEIELREGYEGELSTALLRCMSPI